MQRPPNLGAQKIRKWRKAQTPPMNGADFARQFKIGTATTYRIETGASFPRFDLMRRLESAGICVLADFSTPPLPEIAPGPAAIPEAEDISADVTGALRARAG